MKRNTYLANSRSSDDIIAFSDRHVKTVLMVFVLQPALLSNGTLFAVQGVPGDCAPTNVVLMMDSHLNILGTITFAVDVFAIGIR